MGDGFGLYTEEECIEALDNLQEAWRQFKRDLVDDLGIIFRFIPAVRQWFDTRDAREFRESGEAIEVTAEQIPDDPPVLTSGE